MAWLPAGPTASEAAEIILLLVVALSALFPSVCVFAVLLLCLSFVLRALSWPATPCEHGYPGQGPTRFLCDRDTRVTVPSAFHSTGPWIRLHYGCAALRHWLYAYDCNGLNEDCHRWLLFDTRSRARTSHDLQGARSHSHAECRRSWTSHEKHCEGYNNCSATYSNQTWTEPSVSLSRSLYCRSDRNKWKCYMLNQMYWLLSQGNQRRRRNSKKTTYAGLETRCGHCWPAV